MSFLDEIKLNKSKLKSTETVVTLVNGRRFIESTNTELNSAKFGFVIDTKPDNIPAKILGNLYLGSQDCCDLDVLQKNQITHVLSIGIQVPHFDGIQYKFVDCLDLPEFNLVNILNDCIGFIQCCIENSGIVLVHCNAGISRSPSVVIGFLIRVHNYTFDDAFNFVKSVRSCIRPNDGFVKQLKSLD